MSKPRQLGFGREETRLKNCENVWDWDSQDTGIKTRD